MASTFSSPTIGSAYFYSRANGARHLCRSTGYGLLQTLQTTILDVLIGNGGDPEAGPEPMIGTLPSAGGSSVTIEQMQSASPAQGWDDLSLRALYAFVQFSSQQSTANRAAISAFLSPIAADIMRRTGTLSERTMKAVAWISNSMGRTADGRTIYGLSSPDSITFGSGTVLPVYGSVPPVSTTGSVTVDCTPVSEGDVAGDPVSTTATLGVSPLLLIALITGAVFAMASATSAAPAPARKNPLLWERHRVRTQKRRA